MDEVKTSQTTTLSPKTGTSQGLPLAEKMVKAREIARELMSIMGPDGKLILDPLQEKNLAKNALQIGKLKDKDFANLELKARRHHEKMQASLRQFPAHLQKLTSVLQQIAQVVEPTATKNHQKSLEDRLRSLLGELNNADLNRVVGAVNKNPSKATQGYQATQARKITQCISNRKDSHGILETLTLREQEKLASILSSLDDMTFSIVNYKNRRKILDDQITDVVDRFVSKTDLQGNKIPLSKDDLRQAHAALYVLADEPFLHKIQNEFLTGSLDIKDLKAFWLPSSEEKDKMGEQMAATAKYVSKGNYQAVTRVQRECIVDGLAQYNFKSLSELQKSGVKIAVTDPKGRKDWFHIIHGPSAGKPSGGYYKADINTIFFSEKQLDRGTVTHEFAHVLDHLRNQSKSKNKYYESDSDPVLQNLYRQYMQNIKSNLQLEWSRYATTDAREYIAEGIRMYETRLEYRLTLRQKDPGLYYYIQKFLA